MATDLREGKGEHLRGGNALGGKGGKQIRRERGGGGKISGRKGRRSGEKCLREKMAKISQQGKGWKRPEGGKGEDLEK